MSDTLSWKPPDYSDAGNAVILVNEYHGLLAFCDALGWLSWPVRIGSRTTMTPWGGPSN